MASDAPSEPVGTLETALAHTRRMVGARPDLAQAQAQEILKAAPGHPEALLLLALALRLQGELAQARDILVPLAGSQPRYAAAHHECGLTLAALGQTRPAAAALARAALIDPKVPQFWRVLGDVLTLSGDAAGADDAYARQIQASVNEPLLMEAAAALVEGRLAAAEGLLRPFLIDHPTDVAAIRMLAEVGTRLGRYGDVEKLLARCLELAPSFTLARHNYAIVLYRQNKPALALPHVEQLLAGDPKNPNYRNLHAACLSMVGEYARAIGVYQRVLADFPDQPKIWLSFGHALRTSGRRDEAIAAYQQAIAMEPGLGEAYWSLANLKTVRFTEAEMAEMGVQLGRTELASEDRLHLHYALGKGLEDAGDPAAAFDHYAKGAALRRAETDYDAADTTQRLARAKAVFTAPFFAARAGWGSAAPDPIFVVGLPRSGSTLVEQILASHSAVEGTMELPDLNGVAMELGWSSGRNVDPAYPASLADLDADRLKALGELYLERTRIQRKTDRPLFIDKMPNNFQHIGLIQLILPRARIIDARRHPLASCFSAFKQHFARGQNFSYDLTDLGLYYRDYVALMAHFDAVLPGRVHRVIYEAMVADTEGQVRRLLDYCGLDFEPACLRFHENTRAVRTASSEQVRRPIFRDGLDQWRRFEPWLDPLKLALGPVLDAYPDAPA